MKCAFCEHPQRSELEGRLIRSELTMTEAAHIISRDKSAVSRHMKYHVPHAVTARVKPEPAEVPGLNVVNQLLELNVITRRILSDALDNGDNRTALKAIDSALKQLGAMAELTGQLDYDENANKRVQEAYDNCDKMTDIIMSSIMDVLEENVTDDVRMKIRDELTQKLWDEAQRLKAKAAAEGETKSIF